MIQLKKIFIAVFMTFIGFNIHISFASDSLVVDNIGVAMGKASATTALDIRGSSEGTNASNTTQIRIQNDNGIATTRNMLSLVNNGEPRMIYTNTASGISWSVNPIGESFFISRNVSGAVEMSIQNGGNITIAGTLTENSDRNNKQDIVELDADDILAKIIDMPITEWSYKHAPKQRRIGPMAQDFHFAFGLGMNNRSMAPRDLAGVSVLAIQAQQKIIDSQEAKINSQEAKLVSQDNKIDLLMQELVSLRNGMTKLQAVFDVKVAKTPR